MKWDNKLKDGPAEELCHSVLNQQDVQTVKSLKLGREWLVDLGVCSAQGGSAGSVFVASDSIKRDMEC